jgi:hypothetical protein
MTKGQFAALTVALGLATMAGAGYIAYASADPHGSGANAGGATNSATGTPGGGLSPTAGPGGDGGAGGATAPASQGTAGKTAPAGAAAQACGDADITVSTAQSQGAAGHLSMLLVFTNTSDHICALRGYPGASMLGVNGTDLIDATRTLKGYSGGAVGLSTAPRVVLKPTESASAVLEWSDVPTGSGADGGCVAPDPIALAVTPPNTKQTTTISVAKPQVCAEFQIHPVLKGIVHTPS